MNLIRCDHCKGELRETSPYLTLERSGIDILEFGEHPGPWHFDAWQCLMRFAETKDRTRADGR